MSGLDGIRQDTLPYVPRRFWRDWMAAIKREYPALRVVGELFDGDPALVSFFQGGVPRFDGIDSGVDTLFDFPSFFKVREAFAQGKPLRDLAMTLARDHLYPDASRLVTFLGLHDVPRFMNEPGATTDGLRLAFTFLMTARGTPLVYYGDEIAMPGGGDPDNRRDFPGGWAGRRAECLRSAQGRTPARSAGLRARPAPGAAAGLAARAAAREPWWISRSASRPGPMRGSSRAGPRWSPSTTARSAASFEAAAGPAGLAEGARARGSSGWTRASGSRPVACGCALPARGAAIYVVNPAP